MVPEHGIEPHHPVPFAQQIMYSHIVIEPLLFVSIDVCRLDGR